MKTECVLKITMRVTIYESSEQVSTLRKINIYSSPVMETAARAILGGNTYLYVTVEMVAIYIQVVN